MKAEVQILERTPILDLIAENPEEKKLLEQFSELISSGKNKAKVVAGVELEMQLCRLELHFRKE